MSTLGITFYTRRTYIYLLQI